MLLLLLGLSGAGAAADLVLYNVHVVDAHGPRDVAAVVLRDGVIASVGELPADAADFPKMDLAGQTLMPGLFDAHVHLSQEPGSGLRQDTAEVHDGLEKEALRAYLACGVTGVLDAGSLPESAMALRKWEEEGAPGPDVWLLGPLLSPKGGYPHMAIPEFPEVEDAADARAKIAAFAPLHPVGVKLTIERGTGLPIWPLYTDEVREAILDETRQRDLPRYIHAFSPRAQERALKLDPRGIMHGPFGASRRLARREAAAGVYVVSTLSIYDTMLMPFAPERLDDPLFQRAVPAVERATATSAEGIEAFVQAVSRSQAPHPGPVRWIFRYALRHPGPITHRLRRAERGIAALARGGVAVVLGSDSGSWPQIPFAFHGPTTVRELELLVEAGLSPQDAITAATRTPARMLGLSDRGTIDEGMRADLVVVPGDPLADLSVVRRPAWVIKDGEARTPDGWMAAN